MSVKNPTWPDVMKFELVKNPVLFMIMLMERKCIILMIFTLLLKKYFILLREK